MENNKYTEENWHKDSANWVWGIFYFNKKDNRIFVPKRLEWMGITLNFANPKSYLALLIMSLFFGLIIYMITKKTS
jgi:uncharacterized membrane protein